MVGDIKDEYNTRIGNAIKGSDASFFTVHKSNQRINFRNNDDVYFLTKGNVTAHSSDGYLIFNIFAPEVFGLEKIKGITVVDHLRCVTNAEFLIINKNDAIGLFDVFELWPAAFENILGYIKVFMGREKKLNQPTIKDSVIQYLIYIWSLKPTQRDITSIYSFILLRTCISRSSIHKIVSELEAEGKVVVRRGILIECFLK